MNETTLTIAGNLVDDPEQRFRPGTMVTLSLAARTVAAYGRALVVDVDPLQVNP